MPLLYNAYKAKLLNVLHSKLCKENERKMISLSWMTCLFWRKVVYFQGRPAHTNSHWYIFTGDMPTQTHTSLFSWATCPSGKKEEWSYCNEWPTQVEEWPHCNGWLTQIKKNMENWSRCNGWPTQKNVGLIVMGDLPKEKGKSGFIVMGDLPRWKNGLIVMGDQPR
jgi:hypothetical protein